MAWISPTGHNDPDTDWYDDANAYDDDTGTRAFANFAFQEWSGFLELTIDAVNCDSIRYFVDRNHYMINSIDVDVYYESAWHDVYEGGFLRNEWVEEDIPAGEKSVTVARIRFWNNDDLSAFLAYIYEFDFGVSVTLHELVVTDGIALTDALIKNPIKVLADGIALTDVLIKNPIKVLTDGIALTDTLEKVYIYVRILTDGIAFTDTLVKTTIKVLTDGIAFTDTLVKLWVHGILRILTAIRNLPSIREEGTKR